MTACPERREAVFLHAAGVCEDAERDALEAHLASGCARCAEALESERERLASLVLALEPVTPPARVREQLLARVREGALRGGAQARPSRRPRRASRALLWGAAAAAALAVGLWQLAGRDAPDADETTAAAPQPPDEPSAELAELRETVAEQDAELAALESQVEDASEVAALIGARELDVIELAATEADSDAWGRAFWDPEYRCYFRAEGLPPLGDERRYVLWMEGAEARLHAAGTLEPDAAGRVVFYTRLPRELSPISRTFVTAESEPTGEKPAGPVVLASAAPR